MSTPTFSKRLIEVDLPIRKISEHARREKSIRHGHISTLHIWWARRPLAACRAVICAALWPDPADPLCPARFRAEAEKMMGQFWNPMGVTDRDFSDPLLLRQALLDFIADFSNWDNSTDERYLSTARNLTQTAHESLGGEPGTRPLIVDPFAGGGSIPLEALRVGADAYASDLNPVAVLLNKVVLEYIPKYGKELADEVRKWGQWVKEEAEKELAEFYPTDPDGSTPIAYLWARKIRCEGPGCGAEVPLIRSLWLAKKENRSVGLRLIPDKKNKRIDIDILENPNNSDIKEGTVKRGSAICPLCGYTTYVDRVRSQFFSRQGGTLDSIMFCKVVLTPEGRTEYRIVSDTDRIICDKAIKKYESLKNEGYNILNKYLPPDGALGFRIQKYGFKKWNDILSPRQLVTLQSFNKALFNLSEKLGPNSELNQILIILLSLNLSKIISFNTSLCIWRNVRTCVAQTFGRPTLSMIWDYGEMNPFIGSAGDYQEGINYLHEFIENINHSTNYQGIAERSDAAKLALPDESGDLFLTDPPYYDSIPYCHLSGLFSAILSDLKIIQNNSEDNECNDQECIVDPNLGKTKIFFETKMENCLIENRRVTKPIGLGLIVFAHKSTQGWEAQLNAMYNAGWIITASWPIDTERPGRLRAHDSAVLSSSIHLVCRPRENPDGSLREDVGDWRDVLAELPGRIHDWMPRLAMEGVVGADAIFACLGPALEIFSRYSRVEKVSGEAVPLREYLEHVWAAVSREALGMIFEEADASGFEEDARITAMWLWTLKAAESPALNSSNGAHDSDDEEEEGEEEEGKGSGKKKLSGFSLEYDAARKIAQGLGAHLEEMQTLVEIKKGNARLLPVSERAAFLLKSDRGIPVHRPRKKEKQVTLFPVEEETGKGSGEAFGDVAEIGKTTLDKVHQSMLLFGAGQSDTLKRFLVDEGIGKNTQFWKLAQSLAALYPTGTEERRWVEGVLARKKGFGL